jgi:glycosyltransferase involved in cell wall biosynthesis
VTQIDAPTFEHLNRPGTSDLDISVVICSRNRAASLQETLTCLASADRAGLRVEVVVVNNGSADATPEVVHAFGDRLPVRHVFEPRQGIYGKSHALNRALDEGRLGNIIAVLDDDMSPHPDWFQGVAALCRRWPDQDLFTGRSYVVWPANSPPATVQSRVLATWMFSIIDNGHEDKPMGNSRWFSGNHFWFRSRCLTTGIRFEDIWLTEPKFMLDLVEMGYGAVSGPDAVVGHRIQEDLLKETVIRERATMVGRSNADVRLRPYRHSVKQAHDLRQHPLLGRLFCCGKLVQAGLSWVRAKMHWSARDRFVATVIALERLTYHEQLLRTAAQMPEYRVFRRQR